MFLVAVSVGNEDANQADFACPMYLGSQCRAISLSALVLCCSPIFNGVFA